MYAATTSVALVGGEVQPVLVEAHVGRQQDSFKLSGLPDTAVREAKDRVRAAVASSGIRFPNRTITVNLAPADTPKAGTDFDLPIAMGILAASREGPSPDEVIVVGELALDGRVRPASSALGAGVLSARSGRPCLMARESSAEAAAIPGSRIYGIGTLAEAVALLTSGLDGGTAAVSVAVESQAPSPDMADVRGQALARRSLEVAAAGGHHLLLHGPPGGGKTMLAVRLPGILPPLDDREAIEAALLWAAAGRDRQVGDPPPFRAPHHTASRTALVGGGSGIPSPGEVSLANHGVLFLDELAEFPRSHLDTLRQPLEEGSVTVARRGASLRFPARFQLVGAANPCPCGYHGDRRRPCDCSPSTRGRYRSRLSGPFLDRFDLVVKMGRVDVESYDGPPGESSEQVRSRVVAARQAQSDRGGLNRGIAPGKLEMSSSAKGLVSDAMRSEMVTARGADRIQRVARTIADLDGDSIVSEEHIAEALGLRGDWREQ